MKEDRIEPKFSSFLEVWKVLKGFWNNYYLRYYLLFSLFMNIATGMHDPVNSGGQIILLRKGFEREIISIAILFTYPFVIVVNFLASYLGKLKRE